MICVWNLCSWNIEYICAFFVTVSWNLCIQSLFHQWELIKPTFTIENNCLYFGHVMWCIDYIWLALISYHSQLESANCRSECHGGSVSSAAEGLKKGNLNTENQQQRQKWGQWNINNSQGCRTAVLAKSNRLRNNALNYVIQKMKGILVSE